MRYGVKVIYTYSVGEGKKKYYEMQILLVKAASFEDAYDKAEKYVSEYDREYRNPKGDPVKVENVEVLDCFSILDEEEEVQEIYSAILKNDTPLSEEAFYHAISNECDADDMRDLRYR